MVLKLSLLKKLLILCAMLGGRFLLLNNLTTIVVMVLVKSGMSISSISGLVLLYRSNMVTKVSRVIIRKINNLVIYAPIWFKL